MNVLLTGANGFIGRAIVDRLSINSDHHLVAGYRKDFQVQHAGIRRCHIPDLGSDVDWSNALANIEVVIHCAARVHVMNDQAADSLTEYRKVNVDGTLCLARQAAEAGVRRFIFISSIKVNGEEKLCGQAYTAADVPAPQDPYGISKMEAEQGLTLVAQETGMELVIIRPVLVYGPGVKANFRSMMSWLKKGVPLPLGAIKNKRSLVSVDNLVDLIVTCIDHLAAANQIFLVSDDEDLSTTEMLQRLGNTLGKPARLLPVPSACLVMGGALLGKKAVVQRLCGSLQVDIRHTCETLDWHPPVSVYEGFRRTAAAFLDE